MSEECVSECFQEDALQPRRLSFIIETLQFVLVLTSTPYSGLLKSRWLSSNHYSLVQALRQLITELYHAAAQWMQQALGAFFSLAGTQCPTRARQGRLLITFRIQIKLLYAAGAPASRVSAPKWDQFTIQLIQIVWKHAHKEGNNQPSH